MFLILNMAGALTSYQSFLEKGSTLHLNKARKKKITIFQQTELGWNNSIPRHSVRYRCEPHTLHNLAHQGHGAALTCRPPPHTEPLHGLRRSSNRARAQARPPPWQQPSSATCARPPLSATIRLTFAASCGRRAPADVPASPRVPPYCTHTFFLAPFLPPLVSRLFLPTAILPPRRGKGRAGSSREIIRERCSRENFGRSGHARTGPHLRRGWAPGWKRRGRFALSDRLSVSCGRLRPPVPHGLGQRPVGEYRWIGMKKAQRRFTNNRAYNN